MGAIKFTLSGQNWGAASKLGGALCCRAACWPGFGPVLSQEGQRGSLWSKSAVATQYKRINHVFMDDFKDQDGRLLAGFVLRLGESRFH